jgi:hypothetical protein
MKPPRLSSNSDYGHVEIALADQRSIYLDGHSTLVWHAQLNIQSQGAYFCASVPTGLLHELAGLLDRFLERKGPPTRVEVVLHEPRKRKRKKLRPVVPAAAAPAGDVDHEKEAIKRRMLAGR